MSRSSRKADDQALTLYLADGAVAGRVLQFLPAGLIAHVERPVPADEWLRFTLHLRGAVIGGEVTRIWQEEKRCRLQFAALSPRDMARLEPLIEDEE